MSCENRSYQPQDEIYWQWPAFSQEKARGNVFCVRQENSTEYRARLDAIPPLGQNNDFELARNNRNGEKTLRLSLRIPGIRLESQGGQWQPTTNGFSTNSNHSFRDKLTGPQPPERFEKKNGTDHYLEPGNGSQKRKEGEGRSYGFVSFKNQETDETIFFGLTPSLIELETISFEQKGNDLIISFTKNLEGLKRVREHQFNIFIAQGKEEELFQAYNQRLQTFVKDLAEKEEGVLPNTEGYKIWFSWPAKGPQINQGFIADQISRAQLLGIDVMLFDDGWQEPGYNLRVDRKRFPLMEKLLKKINETVIDEKTGKKMKAAVWLPLLRRPKKSEIYQTHPEWFMKKPVSGFVPQKDPKTPLEIFAKNWALDLSLPEVRQYLCRKFIELAKTGFRVFKVDFLNDAFLAEMQNKQDRTSLECYRSFWKELRQALEDYPEINEEEIEFIACTSPIMTLGLTEMTRITDDSIVPDFISGVPKYEPIARFIESLRIGKNRIVQLLCRGHLSYEEIKQLKPQTVKDFIRGVNNKLYQESARVATLRAKALKKAAGVCVDGLELANSDVLLDPSIRRQVNDSLANLITDPSVHLFIGNNLAPLNA